jgi:RNA polymerase sigma-70 factor (ECF subfamily)
MDDTQERRIAQGLREGNPDAWRDLYDAFAERVWRGVARLLGPAASDVADVVQETFIAAAKSARGFDPAKGTLWLWLWGIARMHVALHFRKKDRHDRLTRARDWLAAGNGRLRRWFDGREPSPAEALEASELGELVRATLAELPQEYEDVLTAKYLDGQSVEQLARRDRCTEVAVRSRLARARGAFRDVFAKYTEAPAGRLAGGSP